MPLTRFRAENFRCLQAAELELASDFNLIHGVNASGKTSLLEALAYLGRGKSFRGAPPANLVRHGEKTFVLFGRVSVGGRHAAMGVSNGRGGLQMRIDGETVSSSAELAELLPTQVVDPDVHELVAGGPDQRRRYLDGIAFHVEHRFLDIWRRFRRTLKQRNAALKAGDPGLSAWDTEFIEHGEALDSARRAVLEGCRGALEEVGRALLGCELTFEYRPGWSTGMTLGDAVADARRRDLQLGSSQVGPHRADVRVIVEERQAKRLVSRGQQKLLACAMVLAATKVVQAALEVPLLLLLDDPAAELDRAALTRLMEQVYALDSQLVVTSLAPETIRFPVPPRRFHVEHGIVRPDD